MAASQRVSLCVCVYLPVCAYVHVSGIAGVEVCCCGRVLLTCLELVPLLLQVFCTAGEITRLKITDFGLSQNLVDGACEISPTTDGTRWSGSKGSIAPVLLQSGWHS